MTTTTPSLTPRQQQILELMAEGLTRPQIAAQLWLGVHTVATHQRRVYARLGVHTGHGAVAAGYKAGLLREPATSISKEHSRMNDPIALAAELKRKDQILRETEDQLAQARRCIAELSSRLEAVRIREAIVRIPAQPPDPDGGLCEPILYEKPIRDVPTGGVL